MNSRLLLLFLFFFFLRPPAQSLQAKNCKLGVTSEMAHSLTQKLLDCESVSECYFISSLQWYWQSLEQILCLQRFQCDLCDSFATFGDEFQGFAVPRSFSFNGNWYEVVRGGEGVVFCRFVGRRLVRRGSGTLSCFTDVRCGICVWDSDVPSERFSTLPSVIIIIIIKDGQKHENLKILFTSQLKLTTLSYIINLVGCLI